MKHLPKKLELFANVAIIIIALLIVILLIQKFFSATPSSSITNTSLIGSKLAIPNYDWSKKSKNIVLVLQKGCRFCTESASFYQKLIKEIQNQDVEIITVLPQNKEDSNNYLEELGLKNIETRQSTMSSLQVKGTPTIFITNNKGEITNLWVGKLSSEKEIEVISHLQNNKE